jgi:putative membrane protein
MSFSNYMGSSCGVGYGFGWILVQILFLVLIGLSIYFIITKFANKKENIKPEEILKTRLAKGEISKNEFHELKREIER